MQRIQQGFWGLLLSGVFMLTLGMLALVVDVVDEFFLEPSEASIFVYWTTSDELGNGGFYIWRSLDEFEDYVTISEFVESESAGEGAEYVYEDTDVEPGILYYYKLEAVPLDGGEGTFFGPESTRIEVQVTPTPVVTATVTATLTVTITPSPTMTSIATMTPHPRVRFWAEETTLAAGECTIVNWVTKDIKGVHLDAVGVVGEGAQTFCPCETETHYLYVTYPEGGSEEFTLTLNVTGSCEAPTASPTIPPTATEPLPEASPTPTDDAPFLLATETPRSPVSPLPSPVRSVEPTTVVETATVPIAASPTLTSSVPLSQSAMLTPTRPAVQGEMQSFDILNWVVLVAIFVGGIVLGFGFIGGGVWLWRQRQ